MGVFDFLPGRGGDGAEEAASSGEASTGKEKTGETDRIEELTPADFRERAKTLAGRSDVPTLDFTVDSLESVDDLETGSAGGIDRVAYGSYLGETIVREYGGEWTDEGGWQVAVALPDDRTTVAVFDAAEMSIAGDPVFSKVAARLEAEGAVRMPDVPGSPPDPDQGVPEPDEEPTESEEESTKPDEKSTEHDGMPDSPANDSGAAPAPSEGSTDQIAPQDADEDDAAGDSDADPTTDTVVVDDPAADDGGSVDDDVTAQADADATDPGDDRGETDVGADHGAKPDRTGIGGRFGRDRTDVDPEPAGADDGAAGIDATGADAVTTGTGPVTTDDDPSGRADGDSDSATASNGAFADEAGADIDGGPSARDVAGYSTTDYSAHRDVGTDDETEASAGLADEVASRVTDDSTTDEDASDDEDAPAVDEGGAAGEDALNGATGAPGADATDAADESGPAGGIPGDGAPTDGDAATDDTDGADEPAAPKRYVLRDAAEELADGWPARDLDFTPASLPRLDTFVEEQWDGRFRASSLADRTVDHEDTGDPLAQLGAYYGEVLIRWLDGEWVATDDGEGAIAVPDVGEKVERVDVFDVARECLIPPSTFAYRYDALVNRLYVDEATVSDGRADVFDGDRASLTSSDVITQFAETADEFVESWPKYPLDYSPRSVRALDEIAERQTRGQDLTGVALADGTDPESLRLTARATAIGAYFAAVLVRHRDAQWRIDGDDVELVVDRPAGERTVDPVATGADSLRGRGSFVDAYTRLDE